MHVELAAEVPPLRTDATGTIRVGQTRVTLDTLVAAFHDGATAEEIVSHFPTLNLADVYGAIGYYLRHQGEIDEYLREREVEAERIRDRIQAKRPQHGLRDQLLARLKNQEIR